MKILHIILIVLFSLPLCAMQKSSDFYSLIQKSPRAIVLKAVDTQDSRIFFGCVLHLVQRRDSNARLKAVGTLLNIAAKRGYDESVTFLLPHVQTRVTATYNAVHDRLKSTTLTSKKRESYQNIAGMLLKSIFAVPLEKRHGLFLYRVPSEILDHIFDYYTYDNAKHKKEEDVTSRTLAYEHTFSWERY